MVVVVDFCVHISFERTWGLYKYTYNMWMLASGIRMITSDVRDASSDGHARQLQCMLGIRIEMLLGTWWTCVE